MGDTDGSDAMLRRRVAHKVQPSSSSDGADEEDHLIPPASWTFNKDGLPQAIAHRGYKAEFPENTMGAFRGAVEVGAHAIETDVHLSKDDVVVISHVRNIKSDPSRPRHGQVYITWGWIPPSPPLPSSHPPLSPHLHLSPPTD